MEQMSREGIASEDVSLVRAADARYVGQGYELEVLAAPGKLEQGDVEEIMERFHEAPRFATTGTHRATMRWRSSICALRRWRPCRDRTLRTMHRMAAETRHARSSGSGTCTSGTNGSLPASTTVPVSFRET